MKVYESIVTYVPFIYFFVVSSLFGVVYHHDGLQVYQPYTVLVVMLLNGWCYYVTCVLCYFNNIIHKALWQSVIMGVGGILCNNIHLEMMSSFHIHGTGESLFISLIYIVMVFVTRYYLKNRYYTCGCHIIFLFFPLARVWQINLHMYVIYFSLSIVMVYNRIHVDELRSNHLVYIPLVDFFMYLRINDVLVILGFVQLYVDLYLSKMDDVANVEEISQIIEKDREKR